jgi:hypothetical protein
MEFGFNRKHPGSIEELLSQRLAFLIPFCEKGRGLMQLMQQARLLTQVLLQYFSARLCPYISVISWMTECLRHMAYSFSFFYLPGLSWNASNLLAYIVKSYCVLRLF